MKHVTGTDRLHLLSMTDKRLQWRHDSETGHFKFDVALKAKRAVRVVCSEIQEIMNLTVGEGLAVGLGPEAKSPNFFNFWDNSNPDFHILIPVGTFYERNIQEFLEFDELGAYIMIQTDAREEPYLVSVRFQVGTLIAGGVDGFIPLPSHPNAPSSGTLKEAAFYLLKLWKFKALDFLIQRINMQKYWKAVKNEYHLALAPASEDEKASSEDADKLNKILSGVDG